MDLEGFKCRFIYAKKSMPLDQAASFIHHVFDDNPMLAKSSTFNKLEYNHRLATRTACIELEEAMRNAAPWMDYREIIAEFIWPYMRRILVHINGGWYDGLYGTKWGVADAWFVEMWLAYDGIFRRFPGKIPETTQWRMYDLIINETERCTRNYRRKL